MGKIEYTTPIEKPEEPYNVGEVVNVTNPIEAPDEEPVIYYSDQPGAGPEDEPVEDDEEDDINDPTIPPDEEGNGGKAMKAAPSNKAISSKAEQTK
jgi:hypothetical protein